MNLKIANRLLAYRRAHGLSQEDLAEKIGVSRQAVSKWERAEAAPDTDNLIALAALYGVLIDDLINGEEEPQVKAEETPEEDKAEKDKAEKDKAEKDKAEKDKTSVKFTEGDKDAGQEGQPKKATVEGHIILEFDNGWLFAATAVLCTIAYLIMGFTLHRGWACGWIVFMLVPVIPSLVTAIVKRKPTEFLFPVLITGLYLTAGMCFGRWHPEWIMFLTVPVYYIIAEAIEGKKKRQEKDK